jgi:hypothetical protein
MRQQPIITGPVMRMVMVTRMSAWSTSPVLQPTSANTVWKGRGPPAAKVTSGMALTSSMPTRCRAAMRLNIPRTVRTFEDKRLDVPRAGPLHRRHAQRGAP